jgi:hypothetical protein
MPSPSETSVRTNPVWVLRPVIVTPGMAEPWASTMRPEMLPVVCWALAVTAVHSTAASAIIPEMILFLFMPCGLLCSEETRKRHSNCGCGQSPRNGDRSQAGGTRRGSPTEPWIWPSNGLLAG